MDGVVVEARVWREDRDYLRSIHVSAGQAIRSYVAAHRGDGEVQALDERARDAEDRAAALRAAHEAAQGRLRSAIESGELAKTVAERRAEAIGELRAAYLEQARFNHPAQVNLRWISGRVQRLHPDLRKSDMVELLKEVAGEVNNGVGPTD